MTKRYGYPIPEGYLGWVEEKHRYVLFETEQAYNEYLASDEEEVDTNERVSK